MELPHFLSLDGIVINVDKILYIRESEVEGALIGIENLTVDNRSGYAEMQERPLVGELHIPKYTPNQLFELLDGYEKHLRELKTQGLS